MRVLLIPPVFRYSSEYPAFLSLSDFPSGFGFISAVLKQAGHEVFGGNCNNIPGYVDAPTMLKATLTKRIAEVNPDLIGLGGLCTDYKFLKDAIGIIRAVNPEIPIVLGGQIVTQDAEDIYKILQPDYAVKGEGENAIISIAEGKASKGIVEAPVPDLDSLPFPDYEPFGIQDMMDNYSQATRLLYRYSRLNPRLYGVVASRNCPFFCSFCKSHQIYRERSVQNIYEELKWTYEKYHFNILLILDELFAVNKERMKEFCLMVIGGKKELGWDFDWMFQTHASAKLDLETLKMAKEAGCISFSYGLESASPVVLKSMNKKIEPDQVIEAIKLAKEAKVGFSANLIFGDVAETVETIAESLEFWLKYGKEECIFLGTISPYPGSELFEICRKKGMFQDKLAYYENIDKIPVNMTAIADREWQGMLQLLKFLEQSWLFVKTAPIKKLELVPSDALLLSSQGGNYYKMTTSCPFCQEEIQYVERLMDSVQPFWMGTNCVKCGRKIKLVK